MTRPSDVSVREITVEADEPRPAGTADGAAASLRRIEDFEMGRRVPILNVPHHLQGGDVRRRRGDVYCLPMSVKMVHEFMLSPYHDARFRKYNTSLRIDEICDTLPFNPAEGCDVDYKMMDGLNAKLRAMSFQPKRVESVSAVRDELAADRPVIVIYNPNQLANRRRRGMAHASVAVGIDEADIFLLDPWCPGLTVCDRKAFDDAIAFEDPNAVFIKTDLTVGTQLSEFTEGRQPSRRPSRQGVLEVGDSP